MRKSTFLGSFRTKPKKCISHPHQNCFRFARGTNRCERNVQQRSDRGEDQHQIGKIQRHDLSQGTLEKQHLHGRMGPETSSHTLQPSTQGLQHHEHRTGEFQLKQFCSVVCTDFCNNYLQISIITACSFLLFLITGLF